MPAAEGPRGIFRPWQEAEAADAGGIGKSGNAAGAEKTRGADPAGILKLTAPDRGARSSLSPCNEGAVHKGLSRGQGRTEMNFGPACDENRPL